MKKLTLDFMRTWAYLGDFVNYESPKRIDLCADQIFDLFNLPPEVEDITVQLSTEDDKDAYALKRGNPMSFLNKDFSIHHDGTWNWLVLYSGAESVALDFFEETKAKIIYVTVYY